VFRPHTSHLENPFLGTNSLTRNAYAGRAKNVGTPDNLEETWPMGILSGAQLGRWISSLLYMYGTTSVLSKEKRQRNSIDRISARQKRLLSNPPTCSFGVLSIFVHSRNRVKYKILVSGYNRLHPTMQFSAFLSYALLSFSAISVAVPVSQFGKFSLETLFIHIQPY
jgi:hypothetical protein